MNTIKDATLAANTLRPFISKNQLSVIGSLCRGEEGQFFKDKLVEMAEIVSTMPVTYGQDGLGDQAVIHLHYFTGSQDWYITERDTSEEQHQAFGLADFGDGGELGYISIAELIKHGVELDLYWKPRTLSEVRQRKAA